jgi:hypothetical protein
VSGIVASNTGIGRVLIDTYFDVTGNAGQGINASSADGNIEIGVHKELLAPTAIILAEGANGIGIEGVTSGLGTVTITTDANTSIDADSHGIYARLNGANVSPDAGIIITQNGTILSSAGDGINAAIMSGANSTDIIAISNNTIGSSSARVFGSGIIAGTNGTGDITILASADIYAGANTAGTADGIHAQNSANALATSVINVTTYGKIDSANDDGIDVRTFGASTQNIYVYNNVSGGTTGGPNGDDGINVETVDGAAHLVIGDYNNGIPNSYTPTVQGSEDGLELRTTGAGAITVDIDYGSTVRSVDGTTPNSRESAIDITATSTGGVTINNDGEVYGLGTVTDATIKASIAGGNLQINNYGYIHGENTDPDDVFLTVNETGAGYTNIINEDYIEGRFQITGANDDTFRNYVDWSTSRTSEFDGGDDALDNYGWIYTTGTTIIDFGANNLNGDYAYNGNWIGVDGHTTLANLEYFENGGGVIDLQYDGGATTSIMSMPTAYYYTGGTTGYLAVDAYLDSSPNGASDLLEIGSSAGQTEVYVNDVNTGPGGYNPAGITVVRVDNLLGSGLVEDQSDFKLANGPINKGLWTYDLFFDNGTGANSDGLLPNTSAEWVLASYAGASAYNLAEFTGLAQGVWNTTSESWIDRAGDLREALMDNGMPKDIKDPTPPPSKQSGIWGRLIGNGAERSTEVTIEPFPNQPVTIDNGYDQTLWGFQGGIDHQFDGSVASGTLVAGILGGYVTSDVNFNNGDSLTLSGPQVGVYATWLKEGFYVDALLKGDFLSADYNVAGVDDSTDATTWGGRIETGYRFSGATGYFIEPVASLAYTNTSIDDIGISGTNVSFEDGDGLLGKVGARFGGSFRTASTKIDPYLSAGVAGELLGSKGTFFDSGPGLTIEDDAPDVLGEVGLGINVLSLSNGWTGFAKADLQIGDDYFGGTGKIGARWAW